MAVRADYSTQYLAEKQTPQAALQASQNFGLQVLPFDFVMGSVAGDATSTVALRQLPPGLVYFFPTLSRWTWTAFGAGRTGDIGYSAYTQYDLTAVVANTTIFDTGVDIAAAGDAYMGSDYVVATIAKTGGFKLFNSQSGVTIIFTVQVNTIPAAAELHGFLVIAQTAP